MRRSVFFILILTVIYSECHSQERKFVFRSGAGYYADVMAWYNGPSFWLEGGYKTNTGFYLNGRVSVASLDWIISEGMFEDYKTIALRQMADVTFSKPLKLSGSHFLEPGLGFKLKREYHMLPDISFEDISGQTYIYTKYSYIFYEIGFTIYLDYYYEFQSNFFLGLRADTNIIWALGFEGLTISPLFGFRF